jgi:hypothetical protein
VFTLDLCGNLNSGARISVYRQWITKLKQFIGTIREAYYDHVTKIRLYSAERAGDGGPRLFGTPIFSFTCVFIPKGTKNDSQLPELFAVGSKRTTGGKQSLTVIGFFIGSSN